MAVDDVASAVIELHDEAIRRRVRGGDFSALSTQNFTDDERSLLQEAAADEPDVEGFNLMASQFYPALSYVARDRQHLSPAVMNTYVNFFQNRYGASWRVALMG